MKNVRNLGVKFQIICQLADKNNAYKNQVHVNGIEDFLWWRRLVKYATQTRIHCSHSCDNFITLNFSLYCFSLSKLPLLMSQEVKGTDLMRMCDA